jgi:hypothetical protein
LPNKIEPEGLLKISFRLEGFYKRLIFPRNLIFTKPKETRLFDK